MKINAPLLATLLIPTLSALAGEGPPAFVERGEWTIHGSDARHPGYTGRLKRRQLKKRAKTGGALDKIALGRAYEGGHVYWASIEPDITGAKNAIAEALHSIRPNRKKAETWYRKAVESGKDTYARVRLAEFLLLERGSLDEEALSLLREAADGGDPWAKVALANQLRLEGQPKAAWWPLYQAADSDPTYPNREARARMVDYLIESGRTDEALSLWKELGARGSRVWFPDYFHYRGTSMEQLLEFVGHRVQRIYRERAAAGDVEATYRLASRSYDNQFISAEIRHLTRWSDPIVTPGRRDALIELMRGWDAGGEGHSYWLRRAAAAGHTEAMFELASYLQRVHEYGDKEGFHPEALEWHRRAADAGHPKAAEALAHYQAELKAEKARLEGMLDALPE